MSLDCIVQMMGGIGNQLFQYAVAKSLETQFNAHVRFDLSMYRNQSERAISIREYRTTITEISALDRVTLRLSFGRKFSRIQGMLKPLKSWLLWEMMEESATGYDPHILPIEGRWYLRGYWQSPEYFDSIRPLILQQFQPSEPLSNLDQELEQQISSASAVAVHIRRGDLLTNPLYLKQIKLQTVDYYEAAIRELAERVADPHYFIFSDDPKWCRENIRGHSNLYFVDHHDGSTDYVDLFLMSRCKHFITANSTFSWWGAWLSTHQEKIVIVPAVWRSDMTGPPPGLIPSSWQLGPKSASAELSLSQ